MRRQFVKAASAAKMLNAFETKLTEMQSSVESSVKVNSSVALTDEQRDLLWEVIDQYNTSHPVSGNWSDETAHEQRTIADTFGISLADARQIMIDELGFDPNLEGHMEGDHWAEEDLNSATDVKASSSYDLFIYHDDGYNTYIDTNGVYSGTPGAVVTIADMKNYWNNFYDDDPTLYEEYHSDQGVKWLRDTLSHMEPVESCDSVNASDAEEVNEDLEPVKGEQQWGNDQVFMLMDYTAGSEGMESDTFDCLGKFFCSR